MPNHAGSRRFALEDVLVLAAWESALASASNLRRPGDLEVPGWHWRPRAAAKLLHDLASAPPSQDLRRQSCAIPMSGQSRPASPGFADRVPALQAPSIREAASRDDNALPHVSNPRAPRAIIIDRPRP